MAEIELGSVRAVEVSERHSLSAERAAEPWRTATGGTLRQWVYATQLAVTISPIRRDARVQVKALVTLDLLKYCGFFEKPACGKAFDPELGCVDEI